MTPVRATARMKWRRHANLNLAEAAKIAATARKATEHKATEPAKRAQPKPELALVA
jgi:hypothetical protein